MILERLKKKLNANALYLAVMISFIAAVLAFSFLLSKYYSFIEINNFKSYKRLNDNVLSAINMIMQKADFIPLNIEKTVALYDDSLSNVQVLKKQWGVYQVACSSAKWNQLSVQKIAMYGQLHDEKNCIGLYLADHGYYLAVAGDTYLSGKVFLPKLGVRKAYIDGKSFKYDKIVDGTIVNSKEHLPALTEDLINYIKNNLLTPITASDSLVSEKVLNNGKIQNSFFKKTMRIYSGGSINLNNTDIEGNIIIHSGNEITISSNCHLDNVICVAQMITVESGFKGKIQLFATDTIDIHKDVTLQYPSSVISAGIDKSFSRVQIDQGSRIEGTVVAFAEIEASRNVSVRLAAGAEIAGSVYCAGKVEHSGKIYGSVYCDFFFLQTRQGYYENHLLDAWVDPVVLEPKFSTGTLFRTDSLNQINNIISWLN
jgi:hypothetical protein